LGALVLLAERLLLADSSHWNPRIFWVASGCFTPIPATQMVVFLYYWEAASGRFWKSAVVRLPLLVRTINIPTVPTAVV